MALQEERVEGAEGGIFPALKIPAPHPRRPIILWGIMPEVLLILLFRTLKAMRSRPSFTFSFRRLFMPGGLCFIMMGIIELFGAFFMD